MRVPHPCVRACSDALALRAVAARRVRRAKAMAMVMVLLLSSVITVIVVTALSVTVSNVEGARSAKDSSAALAAADAGISAAVSYLQSRGVEGLACSPNCTNNRWGSRTNPASDTLLGSADQRFSVWIEPVAPYPANNPALYRVHSTGRSGAGVRVTEVDLSIKLERLPLPMTIFAEAINGGGSASVAKESIISTGCVTRRAQIDTIAGLDLAYGIPVAVHSARSVTTANDSGQSRSCTPGNRDVHRGVNCNTTYPNDQSAYGGAYAAGSPCASLPTSYPRFYAARDLDGNGTIDVNGSYIRDAAALRTLFSIPEEPFTPDQLETLKQVAKDQGQYYTRARDLTSTLAPSPATHPHSVMYFDLLTTDPGGEVDLNLIRGWEQESQRVGTTGACVPRSLLIIIEGGNAKLNANQSLVASTVLLSDPPFGEVNKANGTADYIGSLFASTINLVGNVNFSLNDCFVNNLSPYLLTPAIEELSYRELDRTS